LFNIPFTTGRSKPNLVLFSLIVILIIVGTVLISSASAVMGKQLANDPGFYFKKHLVSLALGAAAMYASYRIDYSFWRKIAPYGIVLGIFLMLLVFIPALNMEHGGASRWIHLGFISFAPTEIFKITLVIYLAAWLEKRAEKMKSFSASTLPFILVMAISGIIVYLQPDMGTLMVITMTAGIMYFVAGANLSHIVAMFSAGVLLVIAMVKAAPYRMARFMIFLNPESDTSNKGYQINQALLAIGTGGFGGLGFGQSRQKFNYLPEASSDSIFAVASEELGFIRIVPIIILYALLGIVGFKVSQKAPDAFSKMLAIGITSWIIVQATVNICANLSLIPLTGVPLPFLSSGSTSTVSLMFASGILLNISRHAQGENRESRSLRRRNWWSYITSFGRN
jgi:cell division protein FtsW